MRKLYLLVVFFMVQSVCADSPEQAFGKLLNSLYSADAAALQSCFSEESEAVLQSLLSLAQMQPEASVSDISEQLGVVITAEEFSGWTLADLLNCVVTSPGFADELPDRHSISADYEINGDSCTVFLRVSGLATPMTVLMIREGSGWKLDKSSILCFM